MEPRIEICEQPKSTALRFRYITESRKAGSIMGEYSSRTNQSFPSIKVLGYSGPLVAKMFCVTEQGYLHPHKLVGQNCQEDSGICLLNVNTLPSDNVIRFTNVGIQCSKRDDIRSYLEAKKRVVPEFPEPPNLSTIDLTCVCLMFKVYLGPQGHPLEPVMSRVIYDKKHCCDLTISRLSIKSAPANGEEELFILCQKVKKDDLQVVFSLDTWEALGIFCAGDVFKECVVVCKVPAFKDKNIKEPKDVRLFLRQPSTRETGKEVTFTYRPVDHDPSGICYKRQKMSHSSASELTYNPPIHPPNVVPPFPDVRRESFGQDQASRQRTWHGNAAFAEPSRQLFHQPPQQVMAWQVSGPDIFRRDDRRTEMFFSNQPNLCRPNQPFIFSANKGPPVPLHVEEANSKSHAEVDSKVGIGNPMLCNALPQQQQLVEVKAEASSALDHFLFEHPAMNMGGMATATNAFEHRPNTQAQNHFWDQKQDCSRLHNIKQEMGMGFQFGMLFPETTSGQISTQPSQANISSQVNTRPNQQPVQNPHPVAQACHANPLFDPTVCETDFCELTFPELESFSSLNLDDFDPNTLNEFLNNGL